MNQWLQLNSPGRRGRYGDDLEALPEGRPLSQTALGPGRK
jgi:hypothetical protein